MGREIRMVPKGWKHPEHENCSHWGGIDCHKKYANPTDYHYGKCFHPLYDENYEEAARKWLKSCMEYQNSTHIATESGIAPEKKEEFYWDYDGMPPNQEYYRTYKDEDCTCYQIYETVSEGTPVSPVFDSKEDMKAWLIKEGHSPKAAEGFVDSGWAPSMIVNRTESGVVIKQGIDIHD